MWPVVLVAHGHKRATVNVTGCGFNEHSRKWKINYFHLLSLVTKKSKYQIARRWHPLPYKQRLETSNAEMEPATIASSITFLEWVIRISKIYNTNYKYICIKALLLVISTSPAAEIAYAKWMQEHITEVLPRKPLT